MRQTRQANMQQDIVIPIVAGIGNGLLTVPLVRLLKQRLPKSRITIMAGSHTIGEVFTRLSEVHEVVYCKPGAAGMLTTGLLLRRRHCDIFLIPAPSRRWQYLLMAAGIGARRTIMHEYSEHQSLLRRALRFETIPAQRGLHDVQQNLLLLQAFDPTSIPNSHQNEAPVFPLRASDHSAAETLLQSAGLADSHTKPIIVHAGSAVTVLATAKRWPPAHCNQLLLTLSELSDRRIILIEGPDEPGLADEIIREQPVTGVSIIRLRENLGTSAALLQRAALYIGSDSGLAHLAAAVGTPPVTLFGPADPDRMCPFGYRHLVVQASTQTCRACNRYPWLASYPKITCDRDYACMRDISTNDILEKALPFLQNNEQNRDSI
jgi:ADP-heptose:LPS heptosyltransferase